MIVVTVIFIILVLIAAASAGLLFFNRFRRRDRLVVRICRLFELEPRDESAHPDVRHALVSALKQWHTDFDFGQFKRESGVDPDVAFQVAQEVYRDYLALSLADGVFNRREVETLAALANVLHLDTESRERIENQVSSSENRR